MVQLCMTQKIEYFLVIVKGIQKNGKIQVLVLGEIYKLCKQVYNTSYIK